MFLGEKSNCHLTAAATTAKKEFATAVVNTVDDDDDHARDDRPRARVPPAEGVCVHCSSSCATGTARADRVFAAPHWRPIRLLRHRR